MQIDSIESVVEHIKIAGDMALTEQRRTGSLKRNLKPDGSVVTEIDEKVETYLVDQVSRLYPAVNVLAEETVRSFDPAKLYTFALDPIDGTDVFSQGMHGWCVALGLLDADLVPIAGVVYSPSLDLLLFADVGRCAMLNGVELDVTRQTEPLSSRFSLMVPSRVHWLLDLSHYPGKIRNIGSAALHLCFPLIYPMVFGAIQNPTTHIWDIAASHAINLSVGYKVEYLDGRDVTYEGMVEGKPAEDIVLAGSEERVRTLQNILLRIE